ncbi:hypothetical protein EV646_114155 [Kribbella antiqua]|uniref:Uncharacterized protein n=2 Tax=Kribbella antiqua TaxID=2512217 RepID=A0A4R2ICP5_9ACTN|nr:hypothetical protein EV646_114155 [Kribbella antiqua]
MSEEREALKSVSAIHVCTPVASAPSLLRGTLTDADGRHESMRTKPLVRGQIGVGGRSALGCTGKILDIFEGTQQIQQLIVARRLLGKTSAELK